MDLRAAILKEHSKAQTDAIVQYIGDDQDRFAELMELFFSGEYRITQRAAWPMSYSVRNHPLLIRPYFKQLLPLLRQPGVHNAVVRNILRLLQDADIPKAYHGAIMTICFEFITSNDAPAAIKAFSLTILENLSKRYPDIQAELKLVIEDRWAHETPAFKSRARKILKAI